MPRSSVHSSRSASLSSVSHLYNRTLSSMSHDQEHFVRSVEIDESERDEDSPTWPGIRGEFSSAQDDLAEFGEQNATLQPSIDIADSRTASPSRESIVSLSRDSPIKSPSPPARNPSVTSRVASPATRSPSVQSRHAKEARSRGSSAASSDGAEQWKEAVKAADSREKRKSSSSSSLERNIASRQSDHKQEENAIESDGRTLSARSANGGAETKATLGSEADLSQVSQELVRSQSVVDNVYEDMLTEEETADQEWPGVMEGVEGSEAEEMSESDDNDSITKGK